MDRISNNIFRFAPSPTGKLHVGGARTAIFNWLMAKKHSGKFLLRIEDTDRERSTDESINQIYSSLEWFGLLWDEEPILQSSRNERYKEIESALLKKNNAYRCFCTQYQLKEKRDATIKDKKSYVYDKKCRSLPKDIIDQNLKEKLPFSVRINVPSGSTSFFDGVHKEVTVDNSEIDDFIILRTDGTPVYQLSVVVDDFDMGVTHVIRGDDHLSNTPKQIIIYNAMNWPVPSFSHLPLILGENKLRLSKRHGASSVEEFKELGILPDALFNYLCLLGWSPGDDSEILSKNELIELFTIEKVNPRSAVFDLQKLYWMNGKYLSRLKAEKIYELIKVQLSDQQIIIVEKNANSFFQLIDLVKERSRTLNEILDGVLYFFEDPDSYEQKGVQKYFILSGMENLLNLALKSINNDAKFSADNLEEQIRKLAESQEVSAGKIIHPLRLALTGRMQSPGIFEVMEIIGKENVKNRIFNAIKFIKSI